MGGMAAQIGSGEVEAVLSGHRAAARADFESFVATRYGALLGLAYLLTQDRALAEDLVQTTLTRCWLSWPRIRAEDPSAYVRRVMVNAQTEWWRRRKHGVEIPTAEVREDRIRGESRHPLGRCFRVPSTWTERWVRVLVLPAGELSWQTAATAAIYRPNCPLIDDPTGHEHAVPAPARRTHGRSRIRLQLALPR